MKALPRFAPIIAILALLLLVAIGGSALANNSSAPNIDADTAIVRMHTSDVPITDSGTSSVLPSPTTAVPFEPAPAPPPAPTPSVDVPARIPQEAPAPAPQVPLNYQYWDDDIDDDDWDDDDWDDDDD